VREAELTAAEAARKAAEAKQAEVARKANEAKKDEELQRAKRQLLEAGEEARRAREMAKAADEQRMAAVKAAEEAAKASEKARRELTKSSIQPEQRSPKTTSRFGPIGGPDGVGGASFKYWPKYTVATGQSVSTITADGRTLICIGGDRHGTPRKCRWH
jgi:hypothetical protein